MGVSEGVSVHAAGEAMHLLPAESRRRHAGDDDASSSYTRWRASSMLKELHIPRWTRVALMMTGAVLVVVAVLGVSSWGRTSAPLGDAVDTGRKEGTVPRQAAETYLIKVAEKSGFLLPLDNATLEKNPWTKSARRPRDLLLDNVMLSGADVLPDVAPGVPFISKDPEYDAEGWAHSPLPGRGARNKFKLCVDNADHWDVAFPEGWFQRMVDAKLHGLTPGYCVSEVVQDVGGSGCGDADVVIFNEAALIWRGAYKNGDGSYQLPPKHHPGVVYIYFAHESPAVYGSDLLDKRLMDQFDYLAYHNEKGASLWWNYLPSVRHMVQDYEAFIRPFSERQPVLGWLAIDCGVGIRVPLIAEIAKRFPVWSIGSCLNNKDRPEDLPGRDTRSDQQRRRMQMILSRYLFYFSAENSDCPGYNTEKLWMALSRGSVPVYFGDSDVHDLLPCEECVLDVKKFPSVDALVTRMQEIASSEKEYNRIMAWRFQHPSTWPLGFRRGIAVASADVNRLTCSVLREGTRRYKKAAVQVAKTGGYVSGGPGNGDIYAVNDATHPAVRAAAEVAARGESLKPDQMRALMSYACTTEHTESNWLPGARGGDGGDSTSVGSLGNAEGTKTLIMGKRVKDFLEEYTKVDRLTPPEEHFDKTCEDEQKRSCYNLRIR